MSQILELTLVFLSRRFSTFYLRSLDKKENIYRKKRAFNMKLLTFHHFKMAFIEQLKTTFFEGNSPAALRARL